MTGLRGSRSEKIREEHKLLKTYGVGADISKEEWQTYFRDLIARGYLHQTEGEYPVLKLTGNSEDVLKGRVKVELVKTKILQEEKAARGSIAEVSHEKELFANLKELRKAIADKDNMPAYIVLSDATLIEMAAYLPQTLDELRKISGFGDVKLQRYGREFLACITEYSKKKSLASRMELKQPKRERKSHRPVKTDDGTYRNTYQVTLDLHRKGISIADIAKHRDMSPDTIASHLAQFVETGELNAEDFVLKEKIDHLKAIIDKHGYHSLKTIKENASDDVTYADIRFVVSSILAVNN